MFEKVDHFSNITWTKFHLTNTCKIVFETIEDDNLKAKCKEMLEDFKATIKDEIVFLNYIYYKQGFKMGANVVKDCFIK